MTRLGRALLAGVGLGLLGRGIVDARRTFGAVPDRLVLIFDGT